MKRDISIDQAGRIVLPVEVRRQLNLGPGSRLRVAVVAERIELTPEPEPEPEPDPALVSAPSKCKVLRATGAAFDAASSSRAEREARRAERW